MSLQYYPHVTLTPTYQRALSTLPDSSKGCVGGQRTGSVQLFVLLSTNISNGLLLLIYKVYCCFKLFRPPLCVQPSVQQFKYLGKPYPPPKQKTPTLAIWLYYKIQSTLCHLEVLSTLSATCFKSAYAPGTYFVTLHTNTTIKFQAQYSTTKSLTRTA